MHLQVQHRSVDPRVLVLAAALLEETSKTLRMDHYRGRGAGIHWDSLRPSDCSLDPLPGRSFAGTCCTACLCHGEACSFLKQLLISVELEFIFCSSFGFVDVLFPLFEYSDLSEEFTVLWSIFVDGS